MKTLYIIRGLPGSGKTTLGQRIAGTRNTFAADDFFVDPSSGEHKFDGKRLPEAHAYCFSRVVGALHAGEEEVAVTNVFTRLSEIEPYVAAAQAHGYAPAIITVHAELSDDELAARNVHGVPAKTIGRMRMRFEHNGGARLRIKIEGTTIGSEVLQKLRTTQAEIERVIDHDR